MIEVAPEHRPGPDGPGDAGEVVAHNSSETHSEFIGACFTHEGGPTFKKEKRLTDVKATSRGGRGPAPMNYRGIDASVHPPYGVSFWLSGCYEPLPTRPRHRNVTHFLYFSWVHVSIWARPVRS